MGCIHSHTVTKVQHLKPIYQVPETHSYSNKVGALNIRIDRATHTKPFLTNPQIQQQLNVNKLTPVPPIDERVVSDLYAPSVHRASLSTPRHAGNTVTTDTRGSIVATTSKNASGQSVHRKTSFQHGSITQNTHDLSPRSTNSDTEYANDDSSLILTIPFLADLTMKNIRKLQRVFVRKQYKAGEYIQHTLTMKQQLSHMRANSTQGIDAGACDQFYILVSGTVQITLPAVDGQPDVELVELSAGSWFNSSAVVDDTSVNTVNIRAVEHCTVLSLSAKQYQVFAASEKDVGLTLFDKLNKRSVSLSHLPFLQHLSETQLAQLSQLLEFKRFSENDTIFQQNDRGDGMYVVASGSVGIYVSTSDNAEKQVDVVHENSYFGEIALLYDVPRTATIRAITPKCVLIYLSRKSFQLFSKLAPEIYNKAYDSIQQSRTSSLLRVLPLFDVLTKQQSESALESLQEGDSELKLQLLASLFEWQKLPANTTVFSEGQDIDDSSRLYVIVAGNVEITVRTDSGTQRLQALGEREVFGELALLNNTIRTATVTTTTACTFLTLTAKRFHSFLAVAPELQEILQSIVGQRAANIIAQLPLFTQDVRENKPWSKLSILGELCRFEKYNTGDMIVDVTHPCVKFYCVVEGSVTLKSTADSDSTVLSKGSSFGEHCVLTVASTVYSVVAAERAVLLTLTLHAFNKFLSLAPELKSSLIVRNLQPTEPRSSVSDIDTFGQTGRNGPSRSATFHNPIGSALLRDLNNASPVSANRTTLQGKRPSLTIHTVG